MNGVLKIIKKLKTIHQLHLQILNLKKNQVEYFKLEKGEVLCFSGNHIHGSVLGKKKNKPRDKNNLFKR